LLICFGGKFGALHSSLKEFAERIIVMGDSASVGVVAVLVIFPSAIVACMIGCCVRDRGLRVFVGILLLLIGATCGILSAVWALFFAILGVALLFLASKTQSPRAYRRITGRRSASATAHLRVEKYAGCMDREENGTKKN